MRAMIVAMILGVCLNMSGQEHGVLAKTTKFPITSEWLYCSRSQDLQTEFWLLSHGFNVHDRLVSVWQRTYDYSQSIMHLDLILVDRDKKETLVLFTKLQELKSARLIAAFKITKEIMWHKEIPGSIGFAIFDKLDELEEIR